MAFTIKVNGTEQRVDADGDTPLGEGGTSAIVPAVTNAIFAATGKRLGKLPVDPAELRLA